MLDLWSYKIKQFTALSVRFGFNKTCPYALGLHLDLCNLACNLDVCIKIASPMSLVFTGSQLNPGNQKSKSCCFFWFCPVFLRIYIYTQPPWFVPSKSNCLNHAGSCAAVAAGEWRSWVEIETWILFLALTCCELGCAILIFHLFPSHLICLNYLNCQLFAPRTF